MKVLKLRKYIEIITKNKKISEIFLLIYTNKRDNLKINNVINLYFLIPSKAISSNINIT